MSRFVALLRGVNVGKAKRIAMADLRSLLEGLGHRDVSTLLNSGNAVFAAASARTSVDAHAARIHDALRAQFGLDVHVVVKSAADLRRVVGGNALVDLGTDHSRLMVAFTREPASVASLRSVAALAEGAEALHVGPHAVYLWCPDGILESRLAVALLKQVDATTRNWATVLKIAAVMGIEGAATVAVAPASPVPSKAPKPPKPRKPLHG